ncbi:glycoside hydrolase family 16 protein [Winogradskyella ursingii]|uniref:glycoside hydrolase family 16 protein n=1 Tax=Winogradskyella ursingii TaxID=2686079 RepID=UPI0015CE9995|nr:glycoside hydrolase family 16 protein [Winogradskyella ursingii]
MKLYINSFINFLFSIVLLTLWSCSSDSSDDSDGSNSVSNLVVSVNVVGTTAANPNGDGSGVVNVTAAATNAVTYGFKFGSDAEQESTNGNIQKTFTNVGTDTYILTVKAYGEDGDSVSEVETFSVYVEENTDDIIPSNLVLNTTVQGADSNNIYGDGSGVVDFYAQATDAVSYGFVIDGNTEVMSTDGTYQHIFDDVEGVENHEVIVNAYSSTNDSIDSSDTIAVAYYVGTPPVWADEFFMDGAPNSENWTYDLGAGGWGNGEAQTYTNNSENVKVEDGLLKITAKANGSGYTSSRLKSLDLFEFKYGRVDVRAKLPSSAGTWPAIWMMGASFPEIGWPRCGEIDIMEQTGMDKNKVLGTCHWYNTSTSGVASYGLDTSITNASTEFHTYSLIWDANSIKILLDDVQYYVISSNNASIPSTPFQSDFFLILNVAMGGTLGGEIPSGFTEDSMEIDYIRLYQ